MPLPTPALTITVNLGGDQSTIDQCAGAVRYLGTGLIAMHEQCGGSRWFGLEAGDVVRLTGQQVADGIYRVAKVRTAKANSEFLDWNGYFLQTCVGDDYRHWFLEALG